MPEYLIQLMEEKRQAAPCRCPAGDDDPWCPLAPFPGEGNEPDNDEPLSCVEFM